MRRKGRKYIIDSHANPWYVWRGAAISDPSCIRFPLDFSLNILPRLRSLRG